MKMLILGAILISGQVFAQKVTPIKADYRCGQAGGEIAIKFPTASSPARIWQTDPGETHGLELQVKNFGQGRCVGCFGFDALLMGMPVRGNVVESKLTYEVLNEQTRKWDIIMKKVPCGPTFRR